MANRPSMFRKIRDDAGQIVAITRNSQDVTQSAPRLQRWLILGAVPFCLSFLWYPMLVFSLPGTVGQWVAVVLAAASILGMLVGTCVLTWISWPPRANRRIAAWRTRQGFCGACEYTLKNLDTTPDGLIRCSECGAQWRPGVNLPR